MPRIFITGDVHGSLELKKLSRTNFPLGKQLTKEDIMIICGDAAFNWDLSNETLWWQLWTQELPFTVVSVLGNHENYTAIRQLPTEIWNGGIVRKVRPHIMYLENGEIFTINGHSFFVQGGATSIDRAHRIEGKSWWPEEIPSYQEFEHAANNLRAHNMKVDYVLSHTTSNRTIQKFDKYMPLFDPVTNFLDKFVEEEVDYKINFFGHFHMDRTIDDKHWLLYDDIIELRQDGSITLANG